MSISRFVQRLVKAATAPDAPPAGADASASSAGPAAAATGNPAAPLPAPRGPRLNRNVLTVIAVAAFMGVVTMVVFVQPTPQAPPSPAETSPPLAPRTYLDQPVRGSAPPGAGVTTGPNPATAPVAGAPAMAPWLAGAPGAPSATVAAGAAGRDGLAPGYAAGYGGTGTYTTEGTPPVTPSGSAAEIAYANSAPSLGATGPVATPKPLTAAERRQRAFERALEAPATGSEDVDAPGTPSAGPQPTVGRPVLAAGYAPGGSGVGGYADSPAAAARGGLTASAQDDPAAASRAAQFLAGAARGGRTAQALTLDPAPGRYTVQAGTVIPAVLMTEVNSDLPGECLAQVTRDVFDSRTQRIALIPRGSKLLCKYDDQLGAGQSRLLVAWTRVLFPDGRSIQLPGLPATDQAGARGVADQVDRHTRKAFGTAVALSLLSAGVQLSQPRNGSLLAAPTDGQIAAGALGQQLNSLGVQMLQRGLTNQQTIRIRQGTQFNVFLNTDLVFPGPYAGVEPSYVPVRAARGLAQQ